jgi:hypothetical protein
MDRDAIRPLMAKLKEVEDALNHARVLTSEKYLKFEEVDAKIRLTLAKAKFAVGNAIATVDRNQGAKLVAEAARILTPPPQGVAEAGLAEEINSFIQALNAQVQAEAQRAAHAAQGPQAGPQPVPVPGETAPAGTAAPATTATEGTTPATPESDEPEEPGTAVERLMDGNKFLSLYPDQIKDGLGTFQLFEKKDDNTFGEDKRKSLTKKIEADLKRGLQQFLTHPADPFTLEENKRHILERIEHVKEVLENIAEGLGKDAADDVYYAEEVSKNLKAYDDKRKGMYNLAYQIKNFMKLLNKIEEWVDKQPELNMPTT